MLLVTRVQTLVQRARELSANVQTELIDRLEARRLQRPLSTTSETVNNSVDVSSTQPDILQRIQQCLMAVQSLQVKLLYDHGLWSVICYHMSPQLLIISTAPLTLLPYSGL